MNILCFKKFLLIGITVCMMFGMYEIIATEHTKITQQKQKALDEVFLSIVNINKNGMAQWFENHADLINCPNSKVRGLTPFMYLFDRVEDNFYNGHGLQILLEQALALLPKVDLYSCDSRGTNCLNLIVQFKDFMLIKSNLDFKVRLLQEVFKKIHTPQARRILVNQANYCKRTAFHSLIEAINLRAVFNRKPLVDIAVLLLPYVNLFNSIR
jgi:hypothetical protein